VIFEQNQRSERIFVVASASRLWFLVALDRSRGRATVTAETADQASPGEASFQLLAEHLPDLVIFAFDADASGPRPAASGPEAGPPRSSSA
jgi:hypothetical protein